MQKGRTLEEMSSLVHQLTLKIGDRKARLAPIIKELRPLRQQNQELQVFLTLLKLLQNLHRFQNLALQDEKHLPIKLNFRLIMMRESISMTH